MNGNKLQLKLYEDVNFISASTENIKGDYDKHATYWNYINNLIASYYMCNCASINVGDKSESLNGSSISSKEILEMLEVCPVKWRVIGHDYSLYIYNSIDISGNKRISVMLFPEADDCVLSYTFTVSDTGDLVSLNPLPVIMTLSNRKRHKTLLRNFAENIDDAIQIGASYLFVAVTFMIDNMKNPEIDKLNNHSSHEMRAIRKAFSTIPSKYSIVTAINVLNDEVIDSSGKYDCGSILDVKNSIDEKNCPIISLNNDEWDIIDEYVSTTKGNSTFDMGSIVKTQRFGRSISINRWGHKFNCTSYLNDNNELLLCMFAELDSENTIMIEVEFNHIDQFTFSNNLQALNISMLTNNYRKLVSNINQYYDIIPNELGRLSGIGELISNILNIYIVVYDRPTRSTFKSLGLSESTFIGNMENTIICRILGPMEHDVAIRNSNVKGATRTNNGKSTEREYIAEYWYRSAHTRTFKSGITIVIDESICHRNMELSTKEKVLIL